MKHEPVRLLLKALHGVYADEALTPRERADVLADVFDDYRTRTGRDGLADISSLRTPPSEPIVMKAQTRQELAIELLKIKAAELRKAHPELSESQAFAKAYEANAELAQIERAASRAIFDEQATAQHGGGLEKNLALAKRDRAYEELKLKGEELRRADPLLTREGAIAKAMKLYPALANAERSAKSVGPVRLMEFARFLRLWVWKCRISRAGFCDFGVTAWPVAVPPATGLFSWNFDDVEKE